MKASSLNKTRVIAILFTMILSSAAYSSPSDDVIINKMQDHWQQLISEKDDLKRSKMIAEHREMMEVVKKDLGLGSHHGSHSGQHHHMMNSFDMHNSMLDMME